MSNVYDMSGKKKVIFTEELKTKLTYKDIMKIIVEKASEETCHTLFNYGGVNLCPSDVFGKEKINEEIEEEKCNNEYNSCTECWSKALESTQGR